MAKKKKGADGIDAVLLRMEEKLGALGYSDIRRDLPLVDIDPDQPLVGKIAAMKCVKDQIFDTLGKSDEEKRWWLSRMKRYSFFGADLAEGSLIKARLEKNNIFNSKKHF